MTSAFIPCLVFSCYLLDRWNWLSLGQGSNPKATLEVNPGNVAARGGNLTFRCVGLYPSMRFILYRGSAVFKTLDPPGSEATFLLTDLQPADEGAYTCRYHPRKGPTIYSDPSDIIQIKVQGSYPHPTFAVSPGNVTARGGNLIFRCVGLYPSLRFILYRGSAVLKTLDPPGSEATFLLTDLQPADEGPYTCRYHPRTGPTIFSDASDIIQIKVLDLAKPSISWELVTGVKGEYQIHCSATEDRKVKRFFLYKGSATTLISNRKPPPEAHQVTFPISSVNDSTSMEYRCSYEVKESGRLLPSPFSDPVYIRKYAGSYPKPTVEVIPGNAITRGGNLTIRCVGLYPSMRFTLYRGAAVVLPTQDPPGTEATFLLTDLQQEDEGAYTCRYHPRTGPTIYSDASDIIQINVLDYTTSNIIQIVLAAVVLLILLVILVEHCHSSKGNGNSAPESGHE